LAGSPPLLGHGIAHGRQIHHGRHAGKILHEHPGRVIGDFHRRIVLLLPAGNLAQVLFTHHPAVHLAQQVLGKDTDGKRQALDIGNAVRCQSQDIEIPIAAALDLDRSGEIFLFHDSPIHHW
jgi:hypothetical protein